MKKKLINTVKFFAFISLGIFLFWKVYQDQSFDTLYTAAKELDYGLIIFAMLISLISHIVRAMRWQIVLSSMQISTRLDNLFHAIMVGYLANMAIPRMGEVSRSAVIKKYEKIPFTTGFGTIVSERIVDVLIMLAITLFAIFFNDHFFDKFVESNPQVFINIKNLLSIEKLLITITLISVVLILYLILQKKSNNKTSILTKIFDKAVTFKQGMLSILKVHNPILYILYSILIWGLYFLTMIFTFKAFGSFDNMQLTINQMLVVFLMGSYAMLAPVQGGIGAYHFMVIASLVIYGVGNAEAQLFALIVHAVSSVVVVIIGFISLILLPLTNKNTKLEKQGSNA